MQKPNTVALNLLCCAWMACPLRREPALSFYLKGVICRFPILWVLKSAVRVALVFSRDNGACTKHVIVKFLLFKCKASCSGQMEVKAFTIKGTAV